MESLFVNTTIKHTINLDPLDMNNKIQETILQKIRNELEGICIKSGYVKKGSIKILSRSLGQVATSHFNGSVMYNLTLSANVCNPLEGCILNAKIVNINKMGILANAGDSDNMCLTILLAKQHHINNEAFEKLQIDEIITIKVIGKRYEYGDSQISIIAILESPKQKASKPIETAPTKEEEVALSGGPSHNSESEESKQVHIYYNNKDNRWLSRSNLANPFTYNGRIFNTVEHAYQAQKVDINNNENNEVHLNYQDLLTAGSNTYIGNKPTDAIAMGTPNNFKKLGIQLRDNWDDLKYEVIRAVTKEYLKANPTLIQKLLDTGVTILINKGGKVDKCWGVDKNGKGDNHHGKMLMELRNEFKSN